MLTIEEQEQIIDEMMIQIEWSNQESIKLFENEIVDMLRTAMQNLDYAEKYEDEE